MKLGFAMCGSYCTFERVFSELERLREKYDDITPIMSENAWSTDSRYGTAKENAARFRDICGKEVIHTIAQAEPIGPKGLFDLLIIAPATGNTLAKLARGVNDTCVTMAVKAQLRNQRPVLIGLSTNDGLSVSAANIGELLNRRNVYFLPFGQDDAAGKPRSLSAKFELLDEAIEACMRGIQLQPILRQ